MRRLPQWLLAVVLATVLGVVPSVQAIPIVMNFEATDFLNIGGTSAPLPADTVSGSLVWEAESVSAPAEYLISIDLTIAGHTYDVSEIGFGDAWTPNPYLIGGLLGGTGGIVWGTDDFWLVWGPGTTTPEFVYSVQGVVELWGASGDDFNRFEVSAAPVPEPATMLLLGTGLVGLTGFGRKKFLKK